MWYIIYYIVIASEEISPPLQYCNDIVNDESRGTVTVKGIFITNLIISSHAVAAAENTRPENRYIICTATRLPADRFSTGKQRQKSGSCFHF